MPMRNVVRTSRALAGLLVTAGILGCMGARVDLASIASALDVDARGGDCLYDAEALTRATLDLLKTSPAAPLPFAREWSCIALKDNLAYDTRSSCTLHATDVAGVFTASRGRSRRIVGEHFYMHVDPREYAYDLSVGDALDVEVRIQITGPLARDPHVVASMQEKLTRAAALWTSHAPHGSMRFRFVAETSDSSDPHFVVNLAPGEPRTPYDVTWGADWGFHLLAHEVGHMMGLDDEYPQLRKTLGHALGQEPRWRRDRTLRVEWLRCDLGSLMCDSKGETSVPLAHHYYVIARRRFCDVVPEQYPAL